MAGHCQALLPAQGPGPETHDWFCTCLVSPPNNRLIFSANDGCLPESFKNNNSIVLAVIIPAND